MARRVNRGTHSGLDSHPYFLHPPLLSPPQAEDQREADQGEASRGRGRHLSSLHQEKQVCVCETTTHTSISKGESTDMQVHIAEDVEGRGRPENVPRAPGPADKPGYVVEQLSRTYGYSLLVTLPTILFVLALALLPYTRWQEGGESSTPAGAGNTTAQGQVGVVPGVNRNVWTVYTGFVFPTIVALRTMFGTSTSDPRPFSGSERFSWKYAPQ